MTQINLLPWRVQLREQRKVEFFTILSVCLALTFFILVIMHSIMRADINRQTQRNDRLKQEITLLDKKIIALRDLQQQKDRLITRMSIIQTLQVNRPLIVHAFDELVRLLPEGVYLTNIKRSGQVIILTGRAQSNTRVSTFMRNIENSQWLAQPILQEIKQDEKLSSFTNTFVLQLQQKMPIEDAKTHDKGH